MSAKGLEHISIWIDTFLIDRKAQNMASGTLYFYQMNYFMRLLERNLNMGFTFHRL